MMSDANENQENVDVNENVVTTDAPNKKRNNNIFTYHPDTKHISDLGISEFPDDQVQNVLWSLAAKHFKGTRDNDVHWITKNITTSQRFDERQLFYCAYSSKKYGEKCCEYRIVRVKKSESRMNEFYLPSVEHTNHPDGKSFDVTKFCTEAIQRKEDLYAFPVLEQEKMMPLLICSL